MLAEVKLKKLQREYPLGPPGDRVTALFAQLLPLQDPTLETRRLAGSLIAGEVNWSAPNAKTFHCLDDSHVIVVFSKLIDFYQVAARILIAGSSIFSNHLEVRGRDSGSVTVAKLEALFRCWTPQGLADDLPSQISPTSLSPEGEELAAREADCSLLFLISHELGHVLYYRQPTEDDGKNDPILTQEQELQSDVTGMQSVVRSAQSPAEARMRIAAVIATMRVLAVFEALGHKFAGDHPPPLARLQVLFDHTLKFCKTERDFWSLTPVAYAVDQVLEAAGLRAVGNMNPPARTADRMFSALSAVIENVAKGDEALSQVLAVMHYDFEHAPRPNLEQLALIAARMFPPTPTQTESPNQDALWEKKAEVFRSLKVQWPQPMMKMFSDAYTNLYHPGGES
jgi:hypothetical protein